MLCSAYYLLYGSHFSPPRARNYRAPISRSLQRSTGLYKKRGSSGLSEVGGEARNNLPPSLADRIAAAQQRRGSTASSPSTARTPIQSEYNNNADREGKEKGLLSIYPYKPPPPPTLSRNVRGLSRPLRSVGRQKHIRLLRRRRRRRRRRRSLLLLLPRRRRRRRPRRRKASKEGGGRQALREGLPPSLSADDDGGAAFCVVSVEKVRRSVLLLLLSFSRLWERRGRKRASLSRAGRRSKRGRKRDRRKERETPSSLISRCSTRMIKQGRIPGGGR